MPVIATWFPNVSLLNETASPNGVVTAGQGSIVTRTDAGQARLHLNMNGGTLWTTIPVGGTLGVAAVPSAPISATAAETVFSTATAALGANFARASTYIQFHAQGIATAVVNTLRIRARLGGLAGTVILDTGVVAIVANDIFQLDGIIVFRTVGVAGTLVGDGKWLLGTPATATTRGGFVGSTAVDTTVSQNLAITAQWGGMAAGDSVRMDSYVVEVMI
jgi:hypothetical protein